MVVVVDGVVVVVSLVFRLVSLAAVAPLLLVSLVVLLVPRGGFLPWVGCVLVPLVFLLCVVPPPGSGVVSPPLRRF